MSKSITLSLAAGMLLAAGSASAYNVSTEPTAKSLLFEEFTGVNCSGCPDGDRLLETFRLSHPGTVNVISIHAGMYANVDPNYTTPEGNELHNLGISAYPQAYLNRHLYLNKLGMEPAFWAQYGRIEEAEISPVNLWMGVNYDHTTATVTVDVEGYITNDIVDNKLFLNVAMLQNNVLGPQTSGGMGNNYPHNHMLRKLLTPTWGEEITGLTKGEYFTKQYTLVLPESIGPVTIDPAELEFVAYVTRSRYDVYNSVSAFPTFSGLNRPMSIQLQPYKINGTYNFNSDLIEFYVTNKSVEPITSMAFDVTLNGKSYRIDWTGNIPARERQLIVLDTDWSTNTESPLQQRDNYYTVTPVEINGVAYTTNDVISEKGFIPAMECSPNLKISIKNDNNAGDNTYLIKDVKGNVVKEFSVEGNGNSNEFEVTLEKGQIYCFEVNDSWGDGMNSGFGYFIVQDRGNGNMTLWDATSLKGHGSRFYISTSAAGAGVEDLVADSADVKAVEVYDLNGRLLHAGTAAGLETGNLSRGIYVVKYVMSDGSSQVKKVAVN
ncbi:MAG: Omp28-related outer membrane protein [Muribaculaceae bacterium]|nr:Omp28-related outer membrane protein [Muribaculaceae bacterium]